MYLVERLEDDESHAYGPKSDEHRTEDLCSEEVCACTIEEPFAGGEQSGEDCTCETTDAMYGRGAYGIVNFQDFIDELYGVYHQYAADSSDDNRTPGRYCVTTSRNTHHTCQDAV